VVTYKRSATVVKKTDKLRAPCSKYKTKKQTQVASGLY